MNIKKIVSLSSALVLLVFSFVFGTDGKSVTAGAGNGTSETFEEVSEISDVINNLPSSDVYYNGLEDQISEDFKSVTYVEIGKIQQTTNYGSTKYETILDRSLTICYTLEGAYYHNVGTQTEKVSQVDSNNYVLSYNKTELKFDYELYLSSDAVFVKYNNWEFTATEDGDVVELDQMQADLYAAIAASYGKWIDFSYDGPSYDDLENYNPTNDEEAMELYKSFIIAEISSQYIQQLITINDANAQSLSKIGLYLSNSLDKFTQNGNFYKLEDKEHFAAAVGAPVSELTVNKTNPRMIELYYMVSGSGVFAKSNMFFKNLGNTVINVPNKTHMGIEDLFSDYIDSLMGEMANE